MKCSFVKRLHVSAFTQLGHHQVLKCFIYETVQYIMSYKIKSLFYNEIAFLSIKRYFV